MSTDVEPHHHQHHHRSRAELYCQSSHGALYFTPRGHSDRRSLAAAPATLPNPLIGPRPRRPHSIHIVSYPVGFIPRDLRPLTAPAQQQRQTQSTPSFGDWRRSIRSSSTTGTGKSDPKKTKKKKKGKKKKRNCRRRQTRDATSTAGPTGEPHAVPVSKSKAIRVFERILSFFGKSRHPTPPKAARPKTPGHQPSSSGAAAPAEFARTPRVTVQPRSRPVSLLSLGRQLSRLGEALNEEEQQQQQQMMTTMRPASSMVDHVLRPPAVVAAGTGGHGIGGHGHGHGGVSNRNSMLSTMSVKSIMSSSVTEIPKPVASGSGVSCSIILAEPNIFLSGFEHEGHSRENTHSGTALLRGKLVLNVSKNVKLKSVTLKLVGKARTEWPEGIPPLKVDMFEESSLRTQALTFFHAMHDGWETEYGNQCAHTPKVPASEVAARGTLGRSSPAGSNISVNTFMRSRQSSNLTAKELKRLSLQSVQSRSFGKGDSPLPNQTQLKGYKVFGAGTYEYSFELPIDHHQLETTKLQYGSVKWQLETIIERAGAFRPNLHGSKEVSIVRVPDQLSLETSEPISISRQWEDQLHYDIMISGKSFPIGGKIPIAFKLTPLAKVQVHKIKVFVTESIEYWTNDRRVTRKDTGRKILLLEKAAGKPVDRQFERSEIRVVRGGELTPSQREGARAAATRRRALDAQRRRGIAEPLPDPTENILGDLDLGLESYWTSTEMEMNVQIPTCEMMAKDRTLKLNPDCSWKNVNVFHWIKIVMRISRLDPEDPAGKRRRHFEISIDSPFTVLNCRATQANTALPQYSGMDMPTYRLSTSCGCPDAHVIATDPSPSSSTGTLPIVELNPDTLSGALGNATPPAPATATGSAVLPATPAAAHLPSASPGLGISPTTRPGTGSTAANPLQRLREEEHPRPIHLIRVPSYNPPPFDAEDPPPPHANENDEHATQTVLMTPPPNYDMIIGTPSVDGLADYFARLAEYDDDRSGSVTPDAGPGPDAAVATPSSSSGSGTTTTGLGLVDMDTAAAAAALSRRQSEVRIGGGDDAAATARGNDVRADGGGSDSSESSDEDEDNRGTRLTDRSGRVNVANPRTPGGRNVPSRSFDIARPLVQLSMDGVVRRGERR